MSDRAKAKAATEVAALFRAATFYSERQLALVRSRMAMKLGTKMVEAEARVINAKYIRVSPVASRPVTGIAALYYCVGGSCCVISAGGFEI